MNKIGRTLLFPFSAIYDGVTSLRNYFFDKGIYSSQEFDLPLIGVGNLSLGGTGKSPHTEYLLDLLGQEFKMGVLSRGYKRKTSGYVFANEQSTVDQIGDEPLQMKLKYPNVSVAVGENRVMAIPKMLIDNKETQVIVLDDVFQHRYITPGYLVLLTDYNNRYTKDAVIPAGLLRESKRGAKRANIIIVTKCPADISLQEKQQIEAEMAIAPNQQLFFSNFKYGLPYNLTNGVDKLSGFKGDVLLVSGIARPEYLKEALEEQYGPTFLFDYPDHYTYKERDIYDIQRAYENLGNGKKTIVITEKDAVKLLAFTPLIKQLELPLYVQPIKVDFLFGGKEKFDRLITEFVEGYYPEEI